MDVFFSRQRGQSNTLDDGSDGDDDDGDDDEDDGDDDVDEFNTFPPPRHSLPCFAFLFTQDAFTAG